MIETLVTTRWSHERQDNPVEVDLTTLTMWMSQDHPRWLVGGALISNYAKLISLNSQMDPIMAMDRACRQIMGVSPGVPCCPEPEWKNPQRLAEAVEDIPQHLPLA